MTRPYDFVLSPERLKAVRARRENPTGLCHPVRDSVPTVYPWPKMKLGDFFVVLIGFRSKRAMVNGFYAAAARRDWEIAVRDWETPGGPGLRVTLTLESLNQVKREALHRGRPQRFSDGVWAKARTERRKPAPLTKGTNYDQDLLSLGSTSAERMAAVRARLLKEDQ